KLHLKGLWSLLFGLAYPIGGWWFGKLPRLRTEDRLQDGLLLILPGIEGRSTLNFEIARGLEEGGLPMAIEIHDGTTGCWPLFLYHVRHSGRVRRRAARIAAKIRAYKDQFAGRPVFLVGQSGGGGLAPMVLECLPLNCQVTAALLLGPAISRRYDLSRA